MVKIEASVEISTYINRHPNTKTTIRTEEKRSKKGINYLSYEIGNPINISRVSYGELTKQASSYVKISEKLCDIYQRDQLFRKLVNILILRFENEAIGSLVEDYPIATLTGVRFGTDTMIDQSGDFKTVEMNLGPVGGPPEAIRVEETQNNIVFPISADEYTDYFIAGLDTFYRKSCEVFGKEPKSLETRHLAIVENDEWTPGNFIILDLFRRKNIDIEIAPREAFVYDNKTNVLKLVTGNSEKIIDQLILYFHLQDDFNSQIPEQAGDIVRAISNKAVIAETSMLPLIVLASKSMAGLISQIANEPDGYFARRWNLDKSDLEAVRNMFPRTYHWRRRTFSAMEKKGLNRFDLLKNLKEQKLIPKSTRTNLFAGMGVYGTDNKKGRKGYEEFYQALKDEVFTALTRNGTAEYVFSNLFSENFIPMLEAYMFQNDPKGLVNNKNRKTANISCVLKAVKHGLVDELAGLNLTKLQLDNIQSLHDRLVNSHFNGQSEVEEFFIDLSSLLMESLGIDVNLGNKNRIMKGLICYASTYIILPFVLQEKIEPSTPNELRTSGFVVNPPHNIVPIISTLRRSEVEGGLRSVHIMLPK
jgi:hypothetical protein